PDPDHHQVSSPTMHVAQQLSKRYVVLKIENVPEGLHLGRMVIEHQEHASERQHDEKVESDPAHSPRIAVAHRITIDLGRVQVQENVRKHAKCPVARRIVVLVTEDGSVN